jgi:hypothetical protein
MNHLSRRSVLGMAAAAVTAPLAVNALPAFASERVVLPSDAWTYTTTRQPDHSFWDAPRPEVLVGREYTDTFVWRSFFRVPVAAVSGASVASAIFSILLTHTPTGVATPVQLFQVSDLDPEVPLSWDNSGGSWLRNLGTASGSSWNTQPDQLLRFDVTSLAQEAAGQGLAFLSFGLRAENETARNQWKKFKPDSVLLEVITL